ncbi:hypothetical protein LC653_15140, partial [Nostoc sp. CHAB 5784]|uniref:hypothetical protein n=1 Tax=Nostoc mirabile TaxID=2907820 RepID=UPI001E45D113
LGFKASLRFGERNGSGVKSYVTKREIKTYVFFFFRMKPPCSPLAGRGDEATIVGVGFFGFNKQSSGHDIITW